MANERKKEKRKYMSASRLLEGEREKHYKYRAEAFFVHQEKNEVHRVHTRRIEQKTRARKLQEKCSE